MARSRLSTIFKNIFDVMCGNAISLISSVINGFVLPYVLGVTNYGCYRIFILYSTYTALLHCGFVDGILLEYSGKNYEDLNKTKFRTLTKIFVIFQFIISLILFISSFIVNNKFYAILLVSLSLYTFIFNLWTYYMFISQITMQFKLLSIRNIAQSVLSIVLTLLVCFVYKFKLIQSINYTAFIFIYIFTYFIMLVWYMCTFRNITFGSHYSFRAGIHYLIKLCKMGIYLTIAYQVSNLIMIIDNQLVSMFFKASTYGKYSFSYSMTNTAVTILGAVATVLFPRLKQDTYSHVLSIYHKVVSSLMLVVYFALLAYFPLCELVKIILPNYIQSLSYLRIFLPELGITCSVTMVTFNYYNALGKSKFYFYMSLLIISISAVIDLFMYFVFRDPISVAFGSFIAIFIWYLASEYFLVKWYHVKWRKNLIYMMLMIGLFFISSVVPNLIVGFNIYLVIYLIISILMFKNIIKKNLSVIIAKF